MRAFTCDEPYERRIRESLRDLLFLSEGGRTRESIDRRYFDVPAGGIATRTCAILLLETAAVAAATVDQNQSRSVV